MTLLLITYAVVIVICSLMMAPIAYWIFKLQHEKHQRLKEAGVEFDHWPSWHEMTYGQRALRIVIFLSMWIALFLSLCFF
jgi:hypothetical protein